MSPERHSRNGVTTSCSAPSPLISASISQFAPLLRPVLVANSSSPARDKSSRNCVPLCGEHANIRYVENPTHAEVPALYAGARALLFPGVEDFGITPLEAMATGCPVIALGVGGALETVTGETGVFFTEQSEYGIRGAVAEFERRESEFDVERIRARARDFLKAKFKAQLGRGDRFSILGQRFYFGLFCKACPLPRR